jgi:arsenite methyltransferase
VTEPDAIPAPRPPVPDQPAVAGGGIDRDAVQEAVRDHYAAAALGVTSGDGSRGCCAAEPGIGSACYPGDDLAGLPAAAVAASIGCANPVAVAELAEGEVVLDLGSGGGIDVLLSARRVGPTGKAYGLDMTDEMLDLARRNQRQAAVDNVEFLKGHMEAIPLPDATVDVVLSNCVIALSVDKQSVFAEAFRVLRPGGRLALADVVAEREPEPGAAVDVAAWTDCVSGALTEPQYRSVLETTGFVDASIQFSHAIGDEASSVIVQARKPAPRP